MDLLKALCANCKPGGLNLDIGANVGGYTNAMLEHPGIVHAFEPVPKLAADIRERFKNEPRVTVFQKGVSDHSYHEDGLTVFEAWTLGKAGQPNKRGLSLGALDGEFKVGREPFAVDFTTVDEHVRGTMPVRFIKIDTDGYEFRVLKGAVNTILEYKPNILIELGYLVADVGDSIEDMMAFIHDDLGYCVTADSGALMPYHTWREWYPHNTTRDYALTPLHRPLSVAP